MTSETKSLVDRYIDWLREKSSEEDLAGDWKLLTIPFLDRHNDALQVFVGPGHEGLRITDEGRIIRDLRQAGCDLKPASRRREIAEEILRGLGLDPGILDDGAIKTTAVNGEFPGKLHHTLLSMLAIDGLANLSSQNVATIFKEDVEDWLLNNGFRYAKGVEFVGHSKIRHVFDFELPAGNAQPRRVLHAIPNPDKLHIQSFTYEVLDTREALDGGSPEFIAVLQDRTAISPKQYKSLLAHDIRTMKWSNREEFIPRLTG